MKPETENQYIVYVMTRSGRLHFLGFYYGETSKEACKDALKHCTAEEHCMIANCSEMSCVQCIDKEHTHDVLIKLTIP
jgi:hypothetical protein